jgi:hypothetical protein
MAIFSYFKAINLCNYMWKIPWLKENVMKVLQKKKQIVKATNKMFIELACVTSVR